MNDHRVSFGQLMSNIHFLNITTSTYLVADCPDALSLRPVTGATSHGRNVVSKISHSEQKTSVTNGTFTSKPEGVLYSSLEKPTFLVS